MERYPAKVYVGDVYGRLTAISDLGKGKSWHCKCTCGYTITVQRARLKSGHTKSCGCLADENRKTASITHGMSRTPEYLTWLNMWHRTTYKNHESYDAYKDRAPPQEWKDFEVFFKEVGSKPTPKHTLERLDNTKPYGPGNVAWATRRENLLNKSTTRMFTVNGVTKPLLLWCEEYGIPYTTVFYRLKKTSDPKLVFRK